MLSNVLQLEDYNYRYTPSFICFCVLVYTFLTLTQLGFQIRGSLTSSSFFLHQPLRCWYSLIDNLPSAAFYIFFLHGRSYSHGLSNIHVAESVPFALPPSWALDLYWDALWHGHLHLYSGHFFIGHHSFCCPYSSGCLILTLVDTLNTLSPPPTHTPLLCISINVSICIWMYGRCLRWCSRPSASVSEPEKDCVHLCPLLAFQRATAVTSVKFRSLDKNLVTFHYQIP